MTDLAPYIPEFKSAVLNHIRSQLPDEEWKCLRASSLSRSRYSLPPEFPPLALNINSSAEEVVATACTEDSIALRDVLSPFDHVVEIGHVAGQPVFYAAGDGVYAWSLSSDSGPVLSLWLTFPAYPRSW